MSPDIDARNQGMRVGVALRQDRFDLITRVLGCESDAARARFLDINAKTLYSARQGRIGEEFIAKTLLVLGEHHERLGALNLGTSFEDLFEVGEKAAAA